MGSINLWKVIHWLKGACFTCLLQTAEAAANSSNTKLRVTFHWYTHTHTHLITHREQPWTKVNTHLWMMRKHGWHYTNVCTQYRNQINQLNLDVHTHSTTPTLPQSLWTLLSLIIAYGIWCQKGVFVWTCVCMYVVLPLHQSVSNQVYWLANCLIMTTLFSQSESIHIDLIRWTDERRARQRKWLRRKKGEGETEKE